MSIVQDGKVYENSDDVPDLGSWECVGVSGNKRQYHGLSKDVGKLPKYDDLGTGSSAMCLDNGDFYFYHAGTKQWYQQ